MTAMCVLVFALYGAGSRVARPSAEPAGCGD
jgi:hypothetical protein